MNPFYEFHENVKAHPERYSEKICQMVDIQRDMLEQYDFVEEKGRKIIDWIERMCVLPEGENAGKPVELFLWQKWLICSVFCFWGWFETPEYDEANQYTGTSKKYLRVVNDIMLVIATGNAKTTLLGFICTYVLFSSDYPAARMFIGSNAQQQSNLCFEMVQKIIEQSKSLRRFARIVPSLHLIEVTSKTGDKHSLNSMSSDGKNYEGIIPTIIIIDETHEMPTSVYADNLRKSTKREDKFIFEATTMGKVRGGYLDARLEYAKKILDKEAVNHRFFCCIFEQESENEIMEAYNQGNFSVFMKSNPSLGRAISTLLVKEKIEEYIADPTKKATTLTKNFNIPQNPINCYFSEPECRAKKFDESIFAGAPVFFGLDMAYTRSPDNDLACLTMMTVNPLTDEEYFKDFYFIPKYYEKKTVEGSSVNIEWLDMAKEKSKVDTNIPYDEKNERYGYREYAGVGDVIIINEELSELLVKNYGPGAACDMTGVTEEFILYFCSLLERLYRFDVCKFGLDPNKANKIESILNDRLGRKDEMPPVIKFQMENVKYSVPVMESTKDIRARGKVYCNNHLTELHFANAQFKTRPDGTPVLINAQRSRKDGVIGHISARSAYTVFTTNAKSGAVNKQSLIEWWARRGGEQPAEWAYEAAKTAAGARDVLGMLAKGAV